jgi:hypothetical protein
MVDACSHLKGVIRTQCAGTSLSGRRHDDDSYGRREGAPGAGLDRHAEGHGWACDAGLGHAEEGRTLGPSVRLPGQAGAHHQDPVLGRQALSNGILVGTRLCCHVERELLKASVRLQKLGFRVRVRASGARAFNYRLCGRE